jgi:organic hydroperoxide reductase OsmC/OhrA
MYAICNSGKQVMAKNREHRYQVTVEWSGNRGTGTSNYSSYSRDHEITAVGKTSISGSSDPAFRGDKTRWNPEELLVASLSACHKLWYIHLCAVAGIAVLAYRDEALGTMVEDEVTGGHFTSVVLRPHVTVREEDDTELALQLHHDAHAKCYVANSVNFPVTHKATVVKSCSGSRNQDQTN